MASPWHHGSHLIQLAFIWKTEELEEPAQGRHDLANPQLRAGENLLPDGLYGGLRTNGDKRHLGTAICTYRQLNQQPACINHWACNYQPLSIIIHHGNHRAWLCLFYWFGKYIQVVDISTTRSTSLPCSNPWMSWIDGIESYSYGNIHRHPPTIPISCHV